MGVRAVTGHGEVIHSGGRVLKNVTGLDLCKLLTGSHGTLGVITEVTLKVLPAPEAVGTLVLPGLDAAAGGGGAVGRAGLALRRLRRRLAAGGGGRARVPALAGRAARSPWSRIEDFAASVAYRTGRLRGRARRADARHPRRRGIARGVARRSATLRPLPAEPADAVWRVSVRPSAGPGRAASRRGCGRCAGYLDWGGGLVWIAGPATDAAHAAVEAAARAAGGTWTLMRAPDALRAAVDVVPPKPAARRITRRVKAALDPPASSIPAASTRAYNAMHIQVHRAALLSYPARFGRGQS